MNRLFTRASSRALGMLVLAIAFCSVLLSVNSAVAVSPNVVISQVYGGGGNSGSTYTHDFIELFNRGASAVNLGTYSVQYASSSGTTWTPTNLTNVNLQPGQYYLVQLAAGAGGTTPLPTPDATGTVAMSGTSFKVALVSNQTALSGADPTSNPAVVDFIGVGTANAFEGAVAPAVSNSTSASRKNNGCTDTDNNASDFTIGSVNPRNTATTLAPCATTPTAPVVTSSSPVNSATGVAMDANIIINFDQPVNLSGEWFALVCSETWGVPVTPSSNLTTISGVGTATVTIDPNDPFVLADNCNFTVFAASVTATVAPNLPMAADYDITFMVTNVEPCSASYTPIYEIQGSGSATALSGQTHTVRGVVVADYEGAQPALRGFYLQDQTGDGNVETSDGIFVFNGSNNNVNVGDLVFVTGTVSEFEGQTQMAALTITTCATGESITPVEITLPVLPAVGGVDYLERFEGMLVRLPQTLYVTEMFQLGRFNQVVVSVNDRQWQPTHLHLPLSTGATDTAAANALGRIILDDALNAQNPDPIVFGRGGNPLTASNTLRAGDTVSDYVGLLTYTWSGNAASGNAWRVRPIGTAYPNFQAVNQRPAPIARTSDLRVTALNLLNYFNTFSGCLAGCRGASDADEFQRQIDKTVPALLGTNADVIAISEIENDGHGSSSAIQQLVNEMNARTAPGTWAFVNPDATLPLNSLGTDAIKVGILYKPSVVTPVGNTAVLSSTAFVNGGDFSPRNRPALAQTFMENATQAQFTVVSNHLKSKGSACDHPDAGDGQGNCNDVRTNAANALIAWLQTYPTGIVEDDVLILGDLNSYAMEDPIMAFKNAGYVDLAFVEAGTNAYSYVFDGQWGYLDYSLASNSLAAQVAHATTWHINSDEPSVLDYLEDFKSTNQQTILYNADEFRVSDHDPVLVDLDLTPITYTLSTVTNGTGAGTLSPASGTFDYNTVVTITATPAISSTLVGWSEVSCGTSLTCAVTITADSVVTATFDLKTFTLATATNGTGEGAVAPDSGTFDYGTVVTVTATPVISSTFAGWSGDCTGTGDCTFVMTENKSITATFDLKTFTLSTATAGAGAGTVSPNSGTFDYGMVVTVTASPAISSTFAGWSGDCTGTGDCVLVMTANKSVTATFDLKTFTLSTDADGTGEGTVAPADGTFDYGTVVTVTASPAISSTFAGWSGDCAGTDNCVLVMTANKAVTATFDIKSFALTTGTNGTGEGALSPDSGTFDYGTVVTIAATPAISSTLVGWSEASCGTALTCPVTITADTHVTATFDLKTFALATVTDGTGAGTVDPVGGTFDYGSVVTVTASSAISSTFAGWSGDCDGTGDCMLVMTESKAVTATFNLKTFVLNTSTDGTGTGTLSPSDGTFNYGEVVTVTATPAPDSIFHSWGGDCFEMDECVLVMTDNRVASAIFMLKTFALTTATNGTGAGTLSPSGGTFDYGEEVVITATPSVSSTLTGWSEASCGTALTCTVSMTSDKNVTATFTLKTFTLDTGTTGTGAGTLSDVAGTYDYGTVVTITASPAVSSTLTGWSEASCGTALTCAVSMTSDKNVTANFDLKQVTLNVVETGSGTGNVAPAGGVYDYGTVVTLVATPNAGSDFIGWSGACQGREDCTLTLTGDTTVTANFTLLLVEASGFTLTVETVGNGFVVSDPAGIDCGSDCSETLEEGTVVTLMASAGDDAQFVGWSGSCTGTGTTCVVMLTEDRAVTATFETRTHEVVTTDSEGGSVLVEVVDNTMAAAVDAEYPQGTLLRFTAVPDEGYVFVGWTGDLAASGASNPVEVEVTGPLTVAALFSTVEYHSFLPMIGRPQVAAGQ